VLDAAHQERDGRPPTPTWPRGGRASIIGVMTDPNATQIEYWNTTAGPTWVAQQERLDAQLGPLGELLLDRLDVRAGERVLDVGCGCGALALAIARRVGPTGEVVGVDVSAPMLARAGERAAGLSNVAFLVGDAQTHRFEPGGFDVVASRFGVMFFADVAAAFVNLREALAPAGRFGFACWQPLERNPWMAVPMGVAARHVDPQPPQPPGSPGPFGLDDPERIRRAMDAAGFVDVVIAPVDAPQNVGGARTVEQAVDFLMNAGPAAAALRGAAPEVRAPIASDLAAALAPYATAAGVVLPGAAWIVTAIAPGR
jgi:SAM-dependent methyltransferase